MGTLCGLAQLHLLACLPFKIHLHTINELIIFQCSCFLGHLKGQFFCAQWGLATVEFGKLSAGVGRQR